MLEIDSDLTLPLKEGDIISVVDDIRVGDTVIFDRVDKENVHLKVLPADRWADHQGPRYRVDKGEKPGSLRLMAFE
jgi:hypothetical protein